ncbi:MAG: patatin-like phospholipase family protein [Bacteroidales bacterium]|jgi:NTE family protein|nr:patatin-like phospholipase family protein [Bacteroidales bacterium]MDD4235162.1 patatin-like phospholipase family protein [Bacteroidales bacterium]MDY0160835.1 patatin-like phospholipase family protein [Bacteroidales bacterium]
MKKTGLALGGGAALGAAHVGVLRIISEYNINIKYVAGTSIGALAASFFAFGVPIDKIEEMTLGLKWVDISRLSLSKYGLLKNDKLSHLIKKYIGDKNIEEANIPLAIVAADVATGEKVVLKSGSLIDAVQASTCIPGIFIPVEIDDRMLVDGGLVENVPVNTVKNMGAKLVIAVDLNAKHKYNKPDNIFDVIINSFHHLLKVPVKLQTKTVDFLLTPDLGEFSRTNTKNIPEMIEKGYIEAQKVLKSIKS